MSEKAWNACGYLSEDQLCGDNEDIIVQVSDADMGKVVENICGKDARTNFEICSSWAFGTAFGRNKLSKLNPSPSDGELSEDSHVDVAEMYNDDDIEELLNSNESPVLSGGNLARMTIHALHVLFAI